MPAPVSKKKVTTDKNGRKGRWVTAKGRKLFIPVEDSAARLAAVDGLLAEAEAMSRTR